MAASSSHLTKKINRHKLLTLSLLLLSLLCFLLFNRRPLDPKLRDLALTSLTPAPLLVSRSPHFQDESDPISLSPNLEQTAHRNATPAPKLSEPHSQEDRNVEETQPVSSNSDFDDKTTHKTSEPEFEDDEPGSSNEENEVPISSNSNLDGEAPQETSEPELSTEDKIALIASDSDSDEKNITKLGETGVNMEEAASSYTGSGGFVDNAVAEKLRKCDLYRGKWVKDEGYPLYRAGSCPYVDEGFDCQSNGRPDSAYTQWRWKPDGCQLPRFSLSLSLLRV